MCCWVISPFLFLLFSMCNDVAVNICINCSFFTFIYYITRTKVHEKNEKKECKKKHTKNTDQGNIPKTYKNTSRKNVAVVMHCNLRLPDVAPIVLGANYEALSAPAYKLSAWLSAFVYFSIIVWIKLEFAASWLPHSNTTAVFLVMRWEWTRRYW